MNKKEFCTQDVFGGQRESALSFAENQTTCSRGKQIPECSGKFFGQARITLVFLSGAKSTEEWRSVDASA